MADGDARDRELEELRAEVSRLRATAQEPSTGPGARNRGWRRPTSIALMIVGGLLLVAAVPAVWAGRTLLNTDRYTETVAPLASDPAIQNSVATAAVDRLFARVNVQDQVEQALPPRADFVAPQIASGMRDFSITAAERGLQTEQFRTLWTEANRRAHERIVPALLSGSAGRTGAVSVEQGAVTVDLTQIVSQVKDALVTRGLTVVENVPDDIAGGEVPLFESAALGQLQSGLRTLQTLYVVLPILAVAVLAGAVLIAPDRRRAVLWLGVTAILAMLAVGVGLALLRDAYVSSPPAGILSGTAAVAFFDTLVRFLRNAIRTVAALGLVLLVGAALAGPSALATRIREAFKTGTGSLGLDLGRPAEWTERHRRALEIGIVVLAAVALFATDRPTPALVLGITVAVLLGFVIVEFVSRSHPTTAGYRGQPSG